MEASEPIDPSATGREMLVNTYDNGIRLQVNGFFRVFVSEMTNQNYVISATASSLYDEREDGVTGCAGGW